jgi:hypothetical protein
VAFATGLRLDVWFSLPWLFTDESSINLNATRETCDKIRVITAAEGRFQEFTKFPVRVMVGVQGTENAEKDRKIVQQANVIEDLDD